MNGWIDMVPVRDDVPALPGVWVPAGADGPDPEGCAC